MFAEYTRDHKARLRLIQRCADVASEIRRADGDQRPRIAYAGVSHELRTQRIAAGWAATYMACRRIDATGDRMVGLDDDGTIRYINLAAGGPLPGDASSHGPGELLLVYELQVLHETRDMIRLVASFADEARYAGTWLLGICLDRMSHRVSQLADPHISPGIFTTPAPSDANDHTATTRATSHQIHHQLELLTEQLTRKLLRGLGSEFILSQPPFAHD